jgi:hypothetical protein
MFGAVFKIIFVEEKKLILLKYFYMQKKNILVSLNIQCWNFDKILYKI